MTNVETIFADLEQEVEALFATREVDWETFAEAAAAAQAVRLWQGRLEYGSKFNNLSLVARQGAGRFCVVNAFLELGREAMYAQQTTLIKRLSELNAVAEEAALDQHLAAHSIKVTPWDATIVYEPKCFYPHASLEWGRLKTHQHQESMRLYEATSAFLRTHPQGGTMNLQAFEGLSTVASSDN